MTWPNEALETTEFCVSVSSLRFSLLKVPPSVSQLGRSAILNSTRQ